MAQNAEREGDRIAARADFEHALTRVQTAAEGKDASDVIRWIARSYHFDGDSDAAIDCLEAAIAIAELGDDDAALGHGLNVKAVVCWQRGSMDEAERLSLLARNRAVRAGDARLAAMTAQNLAVLANIRGDFALAEQQYLASLADYRALGLTADICVALNNLGLLYIAQGRWSDAERVLLEGVQISELAGESVTHTQIDINLAELWVRRGEYARARFAVENALGVAERAGDVSAVGKAIKLLGVISRDTGQFEEAHEYFTRAEELAVSRGELLLQAEIARDRADLARRTGQNRDVLQQLNRAHRLFTQLRAQHDVAEIGERVGSLEQEFLHVARRWGESIEAKDRYTQGHCQRVAELGCAIAKQGGFDDAALFWFRIGALLHDVGKLIIPPEVLNKTERLNDEEWALMKSHTTAGVEMLAAIEFPWDVAPMVESHHERWDGTGYPNGLAGEAIPLIARILTIADVYDALTSVRSYKLAMSHEEALDVLRGDVGSMFDPVVFAWFETVADSFSIPSYSSTGPNTNADDSASKLETDSDHDEVTGMPVRRVWREESRKIFDERASNGRPVSILVIDVDGFRLFNETFGNQQGDSALRLIADRIRKHTRPTDLVARYADDEFVVLLPGIRIEDAVIVAERIRGAVAHSAVRRAEDVGPSVKVTVSVGVACAPMHGDTLDTTFSAADNALYAAKRERRNSVSAALRASISNTPALSPYFAGRVQEKERLNDLLEFSVSGRPHVAVVFGEAGVGKTALLKQLETESAARAGFFLMGQCHELNVGQPYGPWVDIVRTAHLAGLVPPAEWSELSRLVSELDRRERSERGFTSLESGSQAVLLEQIDAYLRAAADAQPLVIGIDDMQWADPASWDMLEYLSARMDHQRVLIALSVRTEDLSELAEERLRRLSRSDMCVSIQLERLDREELGDWLTSSLQPSLPNDELLEYVSEQSEGNPFFAVQTVRTLIEEKRLTLAPTGWQLTKSELVTLPRAINDLVERRIRRFSASHARILALAAVIGREFDPEVLVDAYGEDEADVHEALDEALACGVLASTIGTRLTLTFTHALLSRALLNQVNPLRLRRMHETVARTLESMSSADSAAYVVHYDRAGASADAFRTAVIAAADAETVYAYDNAATLYDVARRHARTPEQFAVVEWNCARNRELQENYPQAELHCELVLTRYSSAAHEQGFLATAKRMRERLSLHRGTAAELVCENCEILLAEAEHDNNVQEAVALLIMLSSARQRIGNMFAADACARKAIELAANTPFHADAMMRLGSLLLVADPADAVPHYRRALDLFIRLGDRAGQMRCHINIGTASDRAGNHPAAEASYLTALEIGSEIRASHLRGVASLNLGVLLLKTGKLDQAEERVQDAITLFTVLGHEPYRLASIYNLAHLARIGGNPARAVDAYQKCIDVARSISQVDVHVGAVAGAGLAALELGRFDESAERLATAFELMGTRQTWWFQGRELLDALNVRTILRSDASAACDALMTAISKAQPHDQYAALWLAAEFRSLLDVSSDASRSVLEMLEKQARALGYQVLTRACG